MVNDTLNVEGVFPFGEESFYVNAISQKIFIFNHESPLNSIQLPFKWLNKFTKIKSVISDKNQCTWIVTFDEGVYCIKDNQVVHHIDIKEGQSIIQDHESNIWISSMEEGIFKISSSFLSYKHYKTGLFQQMGLLALSKANGEGVWMTNGKSVFLLLKNNFYQLNFKNELYTFNCILQLNNRLVVGQKSFYFHVFNGIHKDLKNKQVLYNSISHTKYHLKRFDINNTGTEVCSYDGIAALVFQPDKLFTGTREINVGERVYNTFYNLQNELVINARKNYIFRNNTLLLCKELSRFDNKIITGHVILNDTTELLTIDGDSIFLLCRNKLFNLTSVFESPIDLQIRKVIYDEPTLYISTFRNIYKCDDPQNMINHKPVHLQLVDLNFRNIQDILISNHSLYLASDDGLTIIPEAGLNSITTYIPIPYFKTILVNDKEVNVSENKLRLTGNNKITFDFSCINYSSTPVEYSYRLANSDKTWTTGTVRKVIYQNLTRGNYSFQLRVRKPNSEWSKPVEFKILINATFWQHPMFIIALLLTCAGLFLLFFILRKNIQMKRRELDHQLLTLEQKSLQSMMNPHFIFNSLGSIQNYLLQKKSGQAALYLSQFARLIRQNLNAINVASINLDEEIDRLKNYLDLERMRMDNKFEYDIEVDDKVEADELQIPSMIIQPFVENAIWHGISSIDEKGKIAIKFRMHDEKSIVVLIEDNGIGMERSESFSPKSEEHLSLGMEMTRKRMELLGKKYSVKTAIEFSETSPGSKNPGTRVKLVVPVSS